MKEKIGRELLPFMSYVAIKQTINGRYFYCEQGENSREWEGPLIRKLERLPEVVSGKA